MQIDSYSITVAFAAAEIMYLIFLLFCDVASDPPPEILETAAQFSLKNT
jgi:hypothetical protein